jgi:hypothetical protein
VATGVEDGEAVGDSIGVIVGTTTGADVETWFPPAPPKYFVHKTYPPRAIIATKSNIKAIIKIGELFFGDSGGDDGATGGGGWSTGGCGETKG